ncbi:MAG: DNA replication/repair protein RecF [Aeromonadales bacterium]|nr:DNA replication/repair protein RecF [Aeromonadales bacterium]
MNITRLLIQNFRNLPLVQLNPSSSFNVIHGINGSGKTSLIEAISYLGLGRSFRTSKISSLIRNEEPFFVISAQVDNHKAITDSIAICRHRNKDIQVKVNNQNSSRLVDLVEKICVQVIHPQGIELITDGPELRRNYMDWGVYYSNPDFKDAWMRYRKLLLQRNTLLKNHSDIESIRVWDDQFAHYGELISKFREEYIEKLTPILVEKIRVFLPKFDVKVIFQKGWQNGLQLRSVLDSNLEKDRVLGYTFYGCHRAELKLKCNGFSASETLSRGQLKLLVCAMRLSQGELLKSQTGKTSVYLVDDLSSELDKNSQQLLLGELVRLESQVFITNITKELDLPNVESVLYLDIANAIS